MKHGRCLAKTEKDIRGITSKGMNARLHMRIVGLVAKELLAILYKSHPTLYTNVYGPRDTVLRLMPLWLSLHDLGKVSKRFQYKIWYAIDPHSQTVSEIQSGAGDFIEGDYKHAVITSQHLYRKGLTARKYSNLLNILDAHHGLPAPRAMVAKAEAIDDWESSRDACYYDLAKDFGYEGSVLELADEILSLGMDKDRAKAFAGLLCVADWIGSSIEQKDLRPGGQYAGKTIPEVITTKVQDSGFVGYTLNTGLSFQQNFGVTFTPNPMQQAFIDAVKVNGGGRVYVLEGPMGEGKTEAALAAAYHLLETGQAHGIYFGMPTQVTSNKIFDRVNNTWLSNIVSSGHTSAHLLHGKAKLVAAWKGRAAIGKQFFVKKKSILAPFGVGTIDQSLKAVINTKHSQVAAAALVGRVIILDEVHSYDGYTTHIIKEALKLFTKLGTTVFVLSATLTAAARESLLGGGPHNLGYPLVSWDSGCIAVPPGSDRSVTINETPDALAYAEAVRRFNNGELVLWIENTVSEAQEAFDRLSSAVDPSRVGLIHSRFTAEDRDSNETRWIGYYGKGGDRSQGRILVGTQVLEQSIDIDADYLVTRLCPMDMFLQRLGRLHRHRANDPYRKGGTEAICDYLIPTYKGKGKPSKYGASEKVYPLYDLEATRKELGNRETVLIPGDIRNLMEGVYNVSNHPEFQEQSQAKEASIKDLILKASAATNDFGAAIPEERVTIRLSDRPSTSLILVDSVHGSEVSIGGTTFNAAALDAWKHEGKVAARTISVALDVVSKGGLVSSPTWLQNIAYVGSSPLPQAVLGILTPSGTITDCSGKATTLKYDSVKGLY